MTEVTAEQTDGVMENTVVVRIDGEFARHGMCAMLQQLNKHAVCASTCGVELETILDRAAAAAVIVGWNGDDIDTMAAMSVQCRNRNTPVIFLLPAGDEELLEKAIRVPADGYLFERDLTMTELESAVARAREDGVHLPAGAASWLLESIRMGESESRAIYGRMTPREQQVLELLVDGLSNKQIARMLHISQHGVKRLVSNVLSKLCCTNRTSAVSLALREGLVQRGDNAAGAPAVKPSR